jgi:hypothetical protein
LGTSPTLKAELEPNDAPATAMLATLADTISGSIGREGDVDFFAIDLSAGTQLDANVDITGSALYNPTFSLLATDGVTPLLVHDWQSQEYRLRYAIQTPGRYYLRVGNYRPGTGAYVLRIGRYVIPQFGPGDPVASVWSSSGPPCRRLRLVRPEMSSSGMAAACSVWRRAGTLCHSRREWMRISGSPLTPTATY